MPTRIRVVEKAADILNCFSTQRPVWGVVEISDKLQLDRATVCRILLTLKEKGFVSSDPVSHKYSIGPGIARLASLGVANLDLRSRAQAHLRWLRDRTDETAALAIRVGFERVWIEKAESAQEMKRTVRIGIGGALYSGGAGKLLLASMSDEEIDRFLAGTELTQITEATITDPAALKEAVRQIRGQGFSTAYREGDWWGAGIGVPVHGHSGSIVAALGIVMPAFRYEPARVPELVEMARAAAQRMSADVGPFINQLWLNAWLDIGER